MPQAMNKGTYSRLQVLSTALKKTAASRGELRLQRIAKAIDKQVVTKTDVPPSAA